MRPLLLAVLLVAPVVSAAPKGKGKAKKASAAPATQTGGPNVTLPPDGDAPESVSMTPNGQQHPEGEYSGVKPGVPPLKPGKKPAKGTLSWIGFEAKSGNAEIFLQSVAPFEVTQHLEAGALVVDLAGLDKLGQNTWREVDARFFDTPIARITAKKARKGIQMRVTFKNARDAHEAAMRSSTEGDGMYYQYLDLAGGGTTAPPPDAK